MSYTEEKPLKTELDQLECHFTWDLKKADTDITDHLNKLEHNRDLNLGDKAGTARTHNSLAYVRYLLGSHEEALTNLQRSVELTKEYYGDNCDKKLIVTYGNFAWLHYHMKQYAECKSYLEKLREIKEKSPPDSSSIPHHELLGEKAWALFKFSRKYYARAKECFRKALELEPEEGEWNAGYAIVLYRTETKCKSPKDSSAIQQLRRAIETNPDNDELKLLLALKYAEFKLFDEAEDLVEKALEMSPDSPCVIRYVGKYMRNHGSLDRSIGLLKRALEIAPNSAFIHHQLGLCYKLKKEGLASYHESQRFCRLSISHLEKAITLKSGFIIAMAQLGLLYGEDRQIKRADEVFQTAFSISDEKNDGLQLVHLYYGEFQLYRKNCLPLAIEHYKKCLKMAPDTQRGKKSAKNLRKIASRFVSNAEALDILEFIEQVKGGRHSTAKDCEHVLESTHNEE
ncbi:interferon-induced protein with tetratricopeptide repeats 1-like [Myxocyprinus asiaticus]|uniref:interferon-induced protein with tetratricopeptide repeats 1-like n=1 Tax=Myxocyprinus asiaticus TaxID=70543 RepID=UPI0022235740|nr:interferon-induced protein with tetratricopeptide repeats 1-like [Myxocyprinus asiaticus]